MALRLKNMPSRLTLSLTLTFSWVWVGTLVWLSPAEDKSRVSVSRWHGSIFRSHPTHGSLATELVSPSYLHSLDTKKKVRESDENRLLLGFLTLSFDLFLESRE